jgi:DNA polymerase elongation subunit (family B)
MMQRHNVAIGLESKRRDNCQYSRDTQVRILEMLLMNMDIDGAIKYIREQSKNLLEGKQRRAAAPRICL